MVHKRSIIIIITISHEYLCVVATRGARERQDLDKRNHIRFQIKILSTGDNVYSQASKRLYSVLLGMPFHSTGPAEHYHILCLSRYEMTNLFHVNGWQAVVWWPCRWTNERPDLFWAHKRHASIGEERVPRSAEICEQLRSLSPVWIAVVGNKYKSGALSLFDTWMCLQSGCCLH